MTEIDPTRDLQGVVHQKVGAHLQGPNSGDMDLAIKSHKVRVNKKALSVKQQQKTLSHMTLMPLREDLIYSSW